MNPALLGASHARRAPPGQPFAGLTGPRSEPARRPAPARCLRRTRRLSDGAVPDSADEAPLADTLIEAGERDGTARTLIMALPERQRAAIVLTYYEELPNAEAAEAMEMNIKAFESLLHRARAALRQAFASQGDAP